MVGSMEMQLSDDSEIVIEKDENKFFFIKCAGVCRAPGRKHAAAWPIGAVEKRQLCRGLVSSLVFTAKRLLGKLNWEENITAVLSQLGQSADASRAYIFENKKDDSGRILMSLRYKWVACGMQTAMNERQFQNVPYETYGFGRWAANLSQKMAILDQIKWPPTGEHKKLAICGIKSIALAPVFVHEQWWGFIGMDECRSGRRLFDAILDILQITAAVLGAAIEKGRVEKSQQLKDTSTGSKLVRLGSSLKTRNKFKDIVGKSKAMQKVYDFILQAAVTDAGVILYGESGTGKELVAKAIHKSSKRCDKRFMAVNCGAIPETILESEFFGYRKGAFTGADRDKQGILDLADGGTLFLDEIGELTTNMQVKLLRAIEGGGYTALGGTDLKQPNFRIIAATNKDLETLVKTGKMRDDFFYRIQVISIQLPPLRDRAEDIPLLAAYFLKNFKTNGNISEICSTDIENLKAYRWPGNIRELQNVLYRYVTLGRLELARHYTAHDAPPNELMLIEGRKLPEAVESFERQFIRNVLAKSCWHRGRAALALGICRKTLQRKMRRYGLDPSDP